jgi:hypothetical protein
MFTIDTTGDLLIDMLGIQQNKSQPNLYIHYWHCTHLHIFFHSNVTSHFCSLCVDSGDCQNFVALCEVIRAIDNGQVGTHSIPEDIHA